MSADQKPRILYLRSPEATFRPEKYISDHLVVAFREAGHEVKELSYELFTKLNQALFYDDATMTRSFASTALQATTEMKDGDILFFADAWCPAIPMIKFHAYCSGINIKMFGIFHSSVYTPGDFLYEGRFWSGPLEAHIVDDCLDGVFVATEYGVHSLMQNPSLCVLPDHVVHATGLPPVYAPAGVEPVVNEKPTVIFAHRWAADKQPQKFLALAAAFQQLFPDDPVTFKVLHPVPIDFGSLPSNVETVFCEQRETYWAHAMAADVTASTALLETYGYSILDAVLYGALPFVPNVACYPYLYDQRFIYDAQQPIEDTARCLRVVLDESQHPRSGGLGNVLLNADIHVNVARRMLDVMTRAHQS